MLRKSNELTYIKASRKSTVITIFLGVILRVLHFGNVSPVSSVRSWFFYTDVCSRSQVKHICESTLCSYVVRLLLCRDTGREEMNAIVLGGPPQKSTGHWDTPRGRLSPKKSMKETADESTCLMFLGSNWVLGVTSLWHVFFFEPSASLLFYLLWRNKWKNKQDCVNCLSSKRSSSSNDTCTAYCVKNRSTHCSSCDLLGGAGSHLTHFSEKETGAKRRRVSCQRSPH